MEPFVYSRRQVAFAGLLPEVSGPGYRTRRRVISRKVVTNVKSILACVGRRRFGSENLTLDFIDMEILLAKKIYPVNFIVVIPESISYLRHLIL